MSDHFLRAWAFSSRQEGGYANHPNDPGKETYRGISRRFNPDWAGWEIIDEGKARHGPGTRDFLRWVDSTQVKDRLRLLVRDFYRERYWNGVMPEWGEARLRCELMPWPLCAVVFDAAIHHGTNGRGGWDVGEWLQECLGTTVDGWVGPETLHRLGAVVRSGETETLALCVVQKRWDYMVQGFEKRWWDMSYLRNFGQRIIDNVALVGDVQDAA